MVNDFNEDCEQDNRVTWLQLAGLYLWLAVVITIISEFTDIIGIKKNKYIHKQNKERNSKGIII